MCYHEPLLVYWNVSIAKFIWWLHEHIWERHKVQKSYGGAQGRNNNGVVLRSARVLNFV